ncbi:MAG: hypothetical protein A2Y73_02640 [Chloroflexi bacterium RBG_13_56_8]|nr:MAG: hypothetical protein A2Y73_02640 [Chloroflexi bacterium RBG_13_56_8]
MSRVVIPSLMRDLTQGQGVVDVSGDTVAELIDALDARHPGIRARLYVDGNLDPALIVVINQRPAALGLQARVNEGSEVRFLPLISGG